MARQRLLFSVACYSLGGEVPAVLEQWQSTQSLLFFAPWTCLQSFRSIARTSVPCLSLTGRELANSIIYGNGYHSHRKANPAGGAHLLHRGFAATASYRQYVQHEVPQTEAPPVASDDAALLSNPPKPTRTPLPSPESCPDVAALAQHIQAHGPSYSFKHVAAGLRVLATLATSGVSPSNLEELVQGSVLRTAPTTAQCARRLAALGQYCMLREVDIAAMASCINAFAALNDHAFAAELWMPFVDRLRDAGYYYALQRTDAKVLVDLTHALGKLKPFKYMDTERRKTLGQVVRRLVNSLSSKVSDLSAEDAVHVTQGLARLRRRSHLFADDVALLTALAARVSSELVDNDRLQPDQAVRMLWAYGQLLPRPRDAATLGQPGAATPREPRGGDATKPPPISPYDAPAAAERIARMVRGCLRVSCRTLEAHPPLALVKLAIGVGRLCTRQEAATVLPQVTPILLRSIASLDNSALADVAHAYASVGHHEAGLFEAIAEQILASDLPLTLRDAYFLALSYGRGGCARHTGLWSLLRETIGSAVRDYRPSTLPKLQAVLDSSDPADVEVAALIGAEMRNAQRQMDSRTGTIDE